MFGNRSEGFTLGNRGQVGKVNILSDRIEEIILSENKKKNKENDISSYDFGIPGLDHALDKQKSKLKRGLWGLVAAACLSVCVYQITDRICNYFSFETSDKIELSRNSSVKFPQVTICAIETDKLVEVKREFIQEKIGKNETTENDTCVVNLVDLVGFGGRSAQEVWELTRLDDKDLIEFQAGGENISLEQIDRVMLNGICRVIRIDKKIAYFGSKTQLQIVKKKIDGGCNQNAYLISVEADGKLSDYRFHWLVPAATEIGYSLDVIQSLAYETYRHPCVNFETAEECLRQCQDSKLEKEVKCKLPFMKKSQKQDCKTSSEAEDAFKMAKNVYLQTNANICNCTRKCFNQIYSMLPEILAFGRHETKIALYYSSNAFQIMSEMSSYGFVACVCDIGGNLGLYLGLSIISLFEIIESLVNFKR